jgi:adenine-specific DNA methylase
MWLAKKGAESVALKLIADKTKPAVGFELLKGRASALHVGNGTIRGGTATCPVCGYSIDNRSVRKQLERDRGGASTATLIAIRCVNKKTGARFYRLPLDLDKIAVDSAASALARNRDQSSVPGEAISPDRPSPNARGLSAVTRMGARTFGDLFAPRQALALTTFLELIGDAERRLDATVGPSLARAVVSCLGLAISRLADFNSSLCTLNCQIASNSDPPFACKDDPASMRECFAADGAKTGGAEPHIAEQSRSWRAASGDREVMRGS